MVPERFLITGGEDDLVAVWDWKARSCVARGLGHRSWVTSVAFLDTPSIRPTMSETRYYGSIHNEHGCVTPGAHRERALNFGQNEAFPAYTNHVYRFASVGLDARLLLWEFSSNERARSGEAKQEADSIVQDGSGLNANSSNGVRARSRATSAFKVLW